MNKQQYKALIICYSYHHNNTLKVAKAIAKILNAKIITTKEIYSINLSDFDLIGFGAGIDSGRHYQQLLSLAEELPLVNQKQSFIFSTSAVQGERKVFRDHKTLRDILTSKGYSVVNEFSCKGFNTNLFLKYFGGMNKGRPNAEDLIKAEEFARKLY